MRKREEKRISKVQEQRVSALKADLFKMYEDCKLAGAIVEVSPASDSSKSRSTNDLFHDVYRTRGAAHRIHRVGRTRSRSASPARADAQDGRRRQNGMRNVSQSFRTTSRSASPLESHHRSNELVRSGTFTFGSASRGKGGKPRDAIDQEHSVPADLGLRWIEIGYFRPEHGEELSCNELAVALPRQRKFTSAEFDQFGLGTLQKNCYIKARDGRFYRPEHSENTTEQSVRISERKEYRVWEWIRTTYLKFYIPVFRARNA